MRDRIVLTPTGLLFRGRRLPCTIGRGGVTSAKREGDGATPRGTCRIIDLLFRPDRLARPAPWARVIGLRDLWSDDPADPAYNSRVRAPHGFSHETLRRADPLYDLVLVTDWNMFPAQPGSGSAIFLHQWRRRGFATEGCIAMARPHIAWLAGCLVPGTALMIR